MRPWGWSVTGKDNPGADRSPLGAALWDPRPFQANLLANPFGAPSLIVQAIENQAVTIRADRSTVGIVAPQDPVMRVFIRLMLAQIDHPASLQVMVDGVQKDFVTKTRHPRPRHRPAGPDSAPPAAVVKRWQALLLAVGGRTSSSKVILKRRC